MNFTARPTNTTHGRQAGAINSTIIGFYIAISALSILLNGTFLLVLQRSRKLVKQIRFTYHVTNLALADSLVGISTFGYYVVGRNVVAQYLHEVAWATTLTSLFAVCLMAIERAVVVKRPHRWTDILPLRRVIFVMVLSWILTLILIILSHFYNLTSRFIMLLLFYVPVTITSVMYINVYRHLRMQSDFAQANSSSICLTQKKERLRQRKVGGLVLFLTGVLLVTVMPSFQLLLLRYSCQLFNPRCRYMNTVGTIAQYFYILELLNFCTNPIIYIWRVGLYRNGFWKLFGIRKVGQVESTL